MSFEKHALIEEFFRKLTLQVKNKRLRVEVCAEILSHLEPKIADLIESGLSEDDAVRAALAEMGEPTDLGYELYRTQYPLWAFALKVVAWASVPVVVVVVVCCMIVISNAQKILEAQRENLQNSYLLFIEDQKYFANEDFFAASLAGRDAGELLNEQIEWWNDDKSVTRAIVLNEATRKNIAEAWESNNLPTDLEVIDTTVLQKLHLYDYWDLYASGPNKKYLHPAATQINPMSVPLPEFQTLQALAKVHLLKNMKASQIKNALQEVHHLARLLYTGETLVTSMTSIALLKYEAMAYGRAVQAGLILPNAYSVWTDEKRERAKRMLWGASGFANIISPPEILRSLAYAKNFPIGGCSAMNEMIPTSIMSAKFFRPQFLLEPNYLQGYFEADGVFERAKSECRISYLRLLNPSDLEKSQKLFFDPEVSYDITGRTLEDQLYRYGHLIPYVRRALGMRLSSIAIPNYTRLYEL